MSTDPLFMKQGSEYYWYHNDHLGTPQKMTTSTGAVAWSATYSSFGKATVDSSSSVTNPLRFPGQYEDIETGLYYNFQRYYSHDLGRYLRKDIVNLSTILLSQQILLSRLSNLNINEDITKEFDQLFANFKVARSLLISPQAQNIFSYSFNNPITFDDPSGAMSLKGLLKNGKVRSIASFVASQIIIKAACKMGPGKLRGALFTAGGALSFASAFASAQVAVASFVAGTTVAPTVAGMVGFYATGAVFTTMMVYDLYITNQYLEAAIDDFSGKKCQTPSVCN